MRAALVLLTSAALALSGASCGGGEEPEATPPEEPRALPACAHASAGVDLPAEFPKDFPLPSGTVVTSATSPFEGQLVVAALAPGELQETASFFNDALPERGYSVGVGDAEGTEAEAPFTGNGFRGKWRVNGIQDCAAVWVTLVLIDQG